MRIEVVAAGGRLWSALADHLDRVEMTRWALTADGQPLPDMSFLAIPDDDSIVGHISLRRQPLSMPPTLWSNHASHPVLGSDNSPLQETFIHTFCVEHAYRRRGYGRALQEAALEWTRELGAYQMRSWSSLDKPANDVLKLSLGFAVHPATQQAASGELISGVFFLKTV